MMSNNQWDTLTFATILKAAGIALLQVVFCGMRLRHVIFLGFICEDAVQFMQKHPANLALSETSPSPHAVLAWASPVSFAFGRRLVLGTTWVDIVGIVMTLCIVQAVRSFLTAFPNNVIAASVRRDGPRCMAKAVVNSDFTFSSHALFGVGCLRNVNSVRNVLSTRREIWSRTSYLCGQRGLFVGLAAVCTARSSNISTWLTALLAAAAAARHFIYFFLSVIFRWRIGQDDDGDIVEANTRFHRRCSFLRNLLSFQGNCCCSILIGAIGNARIGNSFSIPLTGYLSLSKYLAKLPNF